MAVRERAAGGGGRCAWCTCIGALAAGVLDLQPGTDGLEGGLREGGGLRGEQRAQRRHTGGVLLAAAPRRQRAVPKEMGGGGPSVLSLEVGTLWGDICTWIGIQVLHVPCGKTFLTVFGFHLGGGGCRGFLEHLVNP